MQDTDMTAQTQKDIEQLTALNLQYLSNDQNSNVAAYDKMLHAKFTASLADLKIYNRKDFLAMIAQPRPFTDLHHTDLQIDLIDNVALVHGIAHFKVKGVAGQARYTDEYMRSGDGWTCIGANVIGETPNASV